ncbi:MAG TPA: arylamine N-acetyltransferase [Terriglobales bacterium]|nr:arylamine N-acetyltransferase [Terriglobales bacterium]
MPDAAPTPPAGWTPELLDVPAYLARVGIRALPEPTEAALRDLHRAHVSAIPFENLDIIVGRGVDVSLPAVQAKLVARGRGGYCFEHNALFAALLDRAGFDVARLAARVRMGAGFVRARTHMTLLVLAEGRPWLADVGFGGDGLLDPIPLEPDRPCRQGGWMYRVVREHEWNWAVQSQRPDGWLDLYGFALEPQHPIDYVMANHFTSTHPLSAFTRVATAQRAAPDRRLTLRGRLLTETLPDGTAEERLVGAGELDDLLRERFGIALGAEDLGRLSDRWPEQPAG